MSGLRVLGVSGSPRQGGNTDDAVMEALAVAREAGCRVEFQRLTDYRIRHCTGCRGCMTAGRCVIRDDEFEAALAPWQQAEVIILGSPVYWLSPSGVLKDFVDRTHGGYRDGGLFRHKRAILISVATAGGFEPHDECLTVWLRHYEAEVLGVIHVIACERGDFLARPEEIEKVRHGVRAALSAIR
jgi:multimeric flavodoxin WrbA